MSSVRISLLILVCGAFFSTPVVAEDQLIYSGFMTDYSQLSKVSDDSADYRYVAPGAEDQLARYDAVMIDQPEVFIAADSPYRGAKPKHLDALAELFRAGVIEGLAEDFYVVDQPGENVLYLSPALSNLRLTKIKKRALGYLPVALVVGGVKGATTTDIAKKANLQGLVMELEIFDSMSGERLVAIIDSIGTDEEQAASWEELDELSARYGRLVHCRLNNARLPDADRVDCLGE